MAKINTALIFAAPPPPLGGVSSIVAMLMQSLGEMPGLAFVTPVSKQGRSGGLFRPMINGFRLLFAIPDVIRGGRVLFFSSAGFSFYEKLVWAFLVHVSGRHAVVVMVDGNFPDFWRQIPALVRFFVQYFFRHTRVTLGVQSERWRLFYQNILPGSMCEIVSATVAREFREPHSRKVTVESRFIVLYVGWMMPEKGVLDLLDAFSSFARLAPDACLRLIGPMVGGMASWQRQICERGIESQVDLLGPLHDRQNLIEQFQGASVFVLPSHFEGFPVALLEAMSLGLPCVGSDVGGIPDILDHGAAGIVVPARNSSLLAEALVNMHNNPELRRALALVAADRVRTVYSNESFADSYLNILNLN